MNTPAGYSRRQIALHWIVALLLAGPVYLRGFDLGGVALFASRSFAHSYHGPSNLPPLPQDRIEEAPVWRIHYINEQIDEVDKRDLFLFLTPQGEFLGASHVDEWS